MLKKILDFIGGKNPEIFDKKGRVEHQLGQKKWLDWDNRNKSNPEYDWKQHSGKSTKRVKT